MLLFIFNNADLRIIFQLIILRNNMSDDKSDTGANYSVYELVNGKGGCYYGVTKNPKRRLSEHKKADVRCLTSSAKLGKNIQMNILETYDNLVDARLTEELLIRNCCCVNDNTPSNIIIKWREGDKKQNHCNYSQMWHAKNKERISTQKKIYYQNNKEKIKARVKLYDANKKKKLYK